MTADWSVHLARSHHHRLTLSVFSSRYVFPAEVLRRISSRITNEVTGINRVTYDISSKPPSVRTRHLALAIPTLVLTKHADDRRSSGYDSILRTVNLEDQNQKATASPRCIP